MISNAHIVALKRTTGTVLMVLVISTILFLTGCSDEQPFATDASTNSAAQVAPLSKNGLVVKSFPSVDNPGPPLYASGLAVGFGGLGAIRADGDWAAITFVREPGCVPSAYNLLSGPHIPQAFFCPLTIEGDVWLNDLSDPNPVKAQQRGLGAVPIYFVDVSELEAASADGELTMAELNGLPSLLIGHASDHKDVIQFPTQGSRPGKHTTVSRGELQDGRSFRFSGVVQGTDNTHTTIVFN